MTRTRTGITPYYLDDSVCIIHGDCREILPLLEPAAKRMAQGVLL